MFPQNDAAIFAGGARFTLLYGERVHRRFGQSELDQIEPYAGLLERVERGTDPGGRDLRGLARQVGIDSHLRNAAGAGHGLDARGDLFPHYRGLQVRRRRHLEARAGKRVEQPGQALGLAHSHDQRLLFRRLPGRGDEMVHDEKHQRDGHDGHHDHAEKSAPVAKHVQHFLLVDHRNRVKPHASSGRRPGRAIRGTPRAAAACRSRPAVPPSCR